MVCGCLLHCLVLDCCCCCCCFVCFLALSCCFFFSLSLRLLNIGTEKSSCCRAATKSTPCGDTETSKLYKLSPKNNKKWQGEKCSNDKHGQRKKNRSNTQTEIRTATKSIVIRFKLSKQWWREKKRVWKISFPIERFQISIEIWNFEFDTKSNNK